MFSHSPRAIPWEKTLPWAPTTINPNTAVVPVSGNPARASACAKGAGVSTDRGVGTSATARILPASAKFAVGRRRDDRRVAVRTPRFKRGTPQRNARIASESRLRRNRRRGGRLRRRVVTQQKFFSNLFCHRPGCYEPPAHSIRNPARYCCADCRQAVRNVLDRERKWRSRNTLAGRIKRSHEYSQRAESRRQRSEQQRDASDPRSP